MARILARKLRIAPLPSDNAPLIAPLSRHSRALAVTG
jgi:hypothetical protein